MTAHQPRRIRPHATPKPAKPPKPHGNALVVRAATLAYDYAAIPEQHRELVQRAALDIRSRLKRTVEDMIEIGRQLNEVKELLPHGRFTEWITDEFKMSDRSARNFMYAAEQYGGKTEIISVLDVTTVYLLASPSTPPEARAAIEAQIVAGEIPTMADARRTIAGYRPPKAPKPKQLPPPAPEPEPDAISAEYTVIAPPPEPVGDVVRLRHELLVKMIDGLAHKVFMPFLTREEHDELFVALAKGLGHE